MVTTTCKLDFVRFFDRVIAKYDEFFLPGDFCQDIFNPEEIPLPLSFKGLRCEGVTPLSRKKRRALLKELSSGWGKTVDDRCDFEHLVAIDWERGKCSCGEPIYGGGLLWHTPPRFGWAVWGQLHAGRLMDQFSPTVWAYVIDSVPFMRRLPDGSFERWYIGPDGLVWPDIPITLGMIGNVAILEECVKWHNSAFGDTFQWTHPTLYHQPRWRTQPPFDPTLPRFEYEAMRIPEPFKKVLLETEDSFAQREFRQAKAHFEYLVRKVARQVKKDKVKKYSHMGKEPNDTVLSKPVKPNSQAFNIATRVEHNVHFPFIENLIQEFQQLNPDVPWLTVIRELGFAFTHCVQANFSMASVFTSATHFLCNVPLGAIRAKLSELVAKLTRRNTQSAGGFGVAVGVAMSAVVALLMGKLPSDKSIDTLINRLSKVGSLITSFDKVSEKSNLIAETVTKFVKVNILGYDEAALNEWKTINDWVQEVNSLQTVDFEFRARNQPDMRQLIDSLLVRGQQIGHDLDLARVPTFQRADYSRAMLFLNQARTIAAGTIAGKIAPRVAPAVIHFYGDSGIGKSSMLGYVNAHILKELGCTQPDDLTEKVYYRRADTEYWDGYRNGTQIVVCDDFGSIKDSAMRPNPQVGETIHMTNTAPYALPMAHLEDKGSTIFEAAAIIWTTNRSHFQFESMTNPEAVYNRIDLKFRHYLKPEFEKVRQAGHSVIKTLDHAKLKEALRTDEEADLKCMLFDLMDPTSNLTIPLETGLTFHQMVEKVLEKLRFKRRMGKEYLARQVNYFHHIVSHNTQSASSIVGAAFDSAKALVSSAGVGATYVARRIIGGEVHFVTKDFVAHLYNPAWGDSQPPGCFTIPRANQSHSLFKPESMDIMGWFAWANTVGARTCACDESQCNYEALLAGQKNWFMRRLENTKRLCLVLGVAVGGLIALWAGAKIWSKFTKKSPNEEGYQQDVARGARRNHENYQQTALRGSKRQNIEFYCREQQRGRSSNQEGWGERIPRPSEDDNAESFTDFNAGQIRSVVMRNIYLFSSMTDGEWVAAGSALCIGGRIFITNRHIWAHSGETVSLTTSYGNRNFDFHKKDCVVVYPNPNSAHGDKDVVMFEAPRHVTIHSNILSFFMTKEDFGHHTTLESVSIVGYNFEGIFRTQDTRHVKTEDRTDFRLVDEKYQQFNIRETYRYGAQTQPGDCGSVIVSFDKRMPRKLCGIHMAGDKNPVYSGVGVALHQEFLREMLEDLAPKVRSKESLANGHVRVPINLECNTHAHGNGQAIEVVAEIPELTKIGSSYKEHEVTSTSLRPSPVQGWVSEPISRPACLRRKNGVDPAKKALAKAATPNVYVNQRMIDEAADDVRQMLAVGVSEEDRRLLTFEASIAGIPGDSVYEPVNRAAGPGYGWTKKGRGKKAWLGHDEWILDNEEFMERFQQIESDVLAGKRAEMVWVDTLKDELRSHEKVDAMKTRAFAAGEMCFTSVLRKYFMGFCAHVMRHPIDFESCVGLNCYGAEWGKLARVLKSRGKAVVAGDFSNYDGTLCSQILWAVLDIIEDFYRRGQEYKEEHAVARRMLWLEIVQSVHLFRGDLYEWTHSQPSGCAFTTILNSVYHSIAVRYAYMWCALEYAPEFASYAQFNEHVAHVNYGDDDVTNISDEIIGWFNQQTMTEAYKTLGMTYTDETKAISDRPFKLLSEVRFLKRAFVEDQVLGVWRAPLPQEVIFEMVNWLGKGDKWELLAQTLEAAFAEASQYSEEEYAVITEALEPVRVEVCSRGQVVRKPSYMAARRNLLQHGMPWVRRDNRVSGVATRQSPNTQSLIKASVPFGGEGRAVTHQSIQARVTTPFMDVQTNPPPPQLTASGESQEQNNTAGPSFSGPADGVSTHQIVDFINDGAVAISVPQALSPSSTLLEDGHDANSNEITDYLQRPVILGEFTWAASTGMLGELFRAHFPRDYLNIPMVNQKLAGFRYARFDLVVEVQLNAQPFNAGALILWFSPMAESLQHKPSSEYSLQGVTGYPNAQYFVGNETSMRLTVPFIGPLTHFDFARGVGTMGDVVLDVMSPLTGSVDVTGTVWVWAENIRFEIPTGFPTYVQPNTQSGRAKRAPMDKEKEAGSITSLTKTAAGIASSLSSIPVVGSFASTASAVLSGVSGLTSIFGWSKPNNADLTAPVVLTPARNLPNYNGQVNARVMAMDTENRVVIPTEQLRTDADEMAFSYILQKETYLTSFNWSALNTTQSALFMWQVDPLACRKISLPTPTPAVALNTYLSYIGSMFTFWRGSINYTFKLVKTPFHSGRLEISFVPGANMDTDWTLVDFNKSYRKILDVRETMEFSFTVPFTWNRPWKVNYFGGKQASGDPDPTGVLVVRVLNALRAPATASDTIEVLVFTSAGEDFQYAVPYLREPSNLYPSKGFPTNNPTPNTQSGRAFYPGRSMPREEAAAQGIGEVMTSFRQYLKRAFAYPYENTLAPFYFSGTQNGHTEDDSGNPSADAFAWVAMLYRFYSGSIVMTGVSSADTNHLTLRSAPALGAGNRAGAHAVQCANIEPIIEVIVPFYQDVSHLPTPLGDPTKDSIGFTSFGVKNQLSGTSLQVHGGTHDWYRSIGEDFNFGFLLGPPATRYDDTIPPHFRMPHHTTLEASCRRSGPALFGGNHVDQSVCGVEAMDQV